MAPLAAVAPYLMIAGAGVSAYGQYQSGQAASAEAKSQAAMQEYNAQLQEREAKQTEALTALEQRRQAEAGARQLSSMRAGMGAAGVVPTAGTPLLIQAKQAEESELENMLIGYEGMEKATALRSGAALSRTQAKAYKQQGKSAKRASYIGAGSTLLSGFSTAAYMGGLSKKPSTADIWERGGS